MDLYFITGNKSKYDEVKTLIPDIKQIDIDLPEIQDIDSHKIIKAKLQEALKHQKGGFIVEDNSLVIKEMNGLPGPLIKWFIKSIGNKVISDLAKIFGSDAEAKVVIGYAEGKENIEFFEGMVEGDIVEPRGESGFGWDPIFQPKGREKTYGEMTMDEKNEFSSRIIAVKKLRDYLLAK